MHCHSKAIVVRDGPEFECKYPRCITIGKASDLAIHRVSDAVVTASQYVSDKDQYPPPSPQQDRPDTDDSDDSTGSLTDGTDEYRSRSYQPTLTEIIASNPDGSERDEITFVKSQQQTETQTPARLQQPVAKPTRRRNGSRTLAVPYQATFVTHLIDPNRTLSRPSIRAHLPYNIRNTYPTISLTMTSPPPLELSVTTARKAHEEYAYTAWPAQRVATFPTQPCKCKEQLPGQCRGEMLGHAASNDQLTS